MIVRNGSARLFPNLLLGIQVRRGDREIDNLQARIFRQKLADRAATMPGSAIPEQQDWTVWESVEKTLQMCSAGNCIQLLHTTNHLASSMQIERAIEADFGPTRVNAHYGRI